MLDLALNTQPFHPVPLPVQSKQKHVDRRAKEIRSHYYLARFLGEIVNQPEQGPPAVSLSVQPRGPNDETTHTRRCVTVCDHVWHYDWISPIA